MVDSVDMTKTSIALQLLGGFLGFLPTALGFSCKLVSYFLSLKSFFKALFFVRRQSSLRILSRERRFHRAIHVHAIHHATDHRSTIHHHVPNSTS